MPARPKWSTASNLALCPSPLFFLSLRANSTVRTTPLVLRTQAELWDGKLLMASRILPSIYLVPGSADQRLTGGRGWRFGRLICLFLKVIKALMCRSTMTRISDKVVGRTWRKVDPYQSRHLSNAVSSQVLFFPCNYTHTLFILLKILLKYN